MLTIEKNRQGTNLTVSLEGRLDTISAPEFEAVVRKELEGVECFVLDLKKLQYTSSAGLRVLLTAHKRMKGTMKLTNVSELVMEVLEMTGFADIWVIA